MHEKKKEDGLLTKGETLIEPELWFHDIVRKDGTPFDPEEISFIKDIYIGADFYDKVSQAFCVYLTVKSIGVVGDERRYADVTGIRKIS